MRLVLNEHEFGRRERLREIATFLGTATLQQHYRVISYYLSIMSARTMIIMLSSSLSIFPPLTIRSKIRLMPKVFPQSLKESVLTISTFILPQWYLMWTPQLAAPGRSHLD